MSKTAIVRSLVVAAGLCGACVSSPAHAEMVDGVMQSLDGSHIVVDGTSRSIDSSTVFEVTQGRKIDPATIVAGTRVRLDVDDDTGVVKTVRPIVLR